MRDSYLFRLHFQKRGRFRVIMLHKIDGKIKRRIIESPTLELAAKVAVDELVLRMTDKSPDIG